MMVPPTVMVSIATGLLSMRNSSCSSASRRAADSRSTRRRFSISRSRLRVTSKAKRPAPASAVNTRMSCGSAVAYVKGNGSNQSASTVQSSAAVTTAQREKAAPTIRIGKM